MNFDNQYLNIIFDNFFDQIKNAQWNKCSEETWEIIQIEGLDEEFDKWSKSDWQEYRLNLPQTIKDKLKQFNEELIIKFNEFDIKLKKIYKLTYIDLIDYEKGKVVIVRYL